LVGIDEEDGVVVGRGDGTVVEEEGVGEGGQAGEASASSVTSGSSVTLAEVATTGRRSASSRSQWSGA